MFLRSGCRHFAFSVQRMSCAVLAVYSSDTQARGWWVVMRGEHQLHAFEFRGQRLRHIIVTFPVNTVSEFEQFTLPFPFNYV